MQATGYLCCPPSSSGTGCPEYGSACMQQTAYVCSLQAEEVLYGNACLPGALQSIVVISSCMPPQCPALQLDTISASRRQWGLSARIDGSPAPPAGWRCPVWGCLPRRLAAGATPDRIHCAARLTTAPGSHGPQCTCNNILCYSLGQFWFCPLPLFPVRTLRSTTTQWCGTACMRACSRTAQHAASWQRRCRGRMEQLMSLSGICSMKAYLCLSSVMLIWVPEGRAELTKSRSVPGRPEMVLTSIASLCATAPQVSVAQTPSNIPAPFAEQ